MILSFRSKGLAELFNTGRTRRVAPALHRRILLRLDRLNAATRVEEMNLPGFDFHLLLGFAPQRYTVHGNGLGVSPSSLKTAMPTASIWNNIIERFALRREKPCRTKR